MIRTSFAALLLVAALGATACSNSPTTPTTTTTTTGPSLEYFTGTLSPKGSQFYSFGVTAAGTVSITLASASNARIGAALPARLTVGVGQPSGFDCAVTSSVDTAAGLTAQLSTAGAASAIYCVNISDPGVLASDALFVIRISHT